MRTDDRPSLNLRDTHKDLSRISTINTNIPTILTEELKNQEDIVEISFVNSSVDTNKPYVLQAGDTLWDLAGRIYGEGNEYLWRAIIYYDNNYEILGNDVEKLIPNKEIKIPNPEEALVLMERQNNTVIVLKGESFHSIAKDYLNNENLYVEIQRANPEIRTLEAGQKIKLPQIKEAVQIRFSEDNLLDNINRLEKIKENACSKAVRNLKIENIPLRNLCKNNRFDEILTEIAERKNLDKNSIKVGEAKEFLEEINSSLFKTTEESLFNIKENLANIKEWILRSDISEEFCKGLKEKITLIYGELSDTKALFEGQIITLTQASEQEQNETKRLREVFNSLDFQILDLLQNTQNIKDLENLKQQLLLEGNQNNKTEKIYNIEDTLQRIHVRTYEKNWTENKSLPQSLAFLKELGIIKGDSIGENSNLKFVNFEQLNEIYNKLNELPTLERILGYMLLNPQGPFAIIDKPSCKCYSFDLNANLIHKPIGVTLGAKKSDEMTLAPKGSKNRDSHTTGAGIYEGTYYPKYAKGAPFSEGYMPFYPKGVVALKSESSIRQFAIFHTPPPSLRVRRNRAIDSPSLEDNFFPGAGGCPNAKIKDFENAVIPVFANGNGKLFIIPYYQDKTDIKIIDGQLKYVPVNLKTEDYFKYNFSPKERDFKAIKAGNPEFKPFFDSKKKFKITMSDQTYKIGVLPDILDTVNKYQSELMEDLGLTQQQYVDICKTLVGIAWNESSLGLGFFGRQETDSIIDLLTYSPLGTTSAIKRFETGVEKDGFQAKQDIGSTFALYHHQSFKDSWIGRNIAVPLGKRFEKAKNAIKKDGFQLKNIFKFFDKLDEPSRSVYQIKLDSFGEEEKTSKETQARIRALKEKYDLSPDTITGVSKQAIEKATIAIIIYLAVNIQNMFHKGLYKNNPNINEGNKQKYYAFLMKQIKYLTNKNIPTEEKYLINAETNPYAISANSISNKLNIYQEIS